MSGTSPRQSPQQILHDGLQSTARITQTIHSLIRKELAAMEAELKQPSIPPARRMELLRCIVELGSELSRQTESIAKLITSKPPANSTDPNTAVLPTADQIMLELREGRKAK